MPVSGVSLGCPPGWFRLCFAYNSISTTLACIDRLTSALSTFQLPGTAAAPAAHTSADDNWASMAVEAIPTKQHLPQLFLDVFMEWNQTWERSGKLEEERPACLDYGCGDGRISADLACLFSGLDMFGTDINPAAIVVAQQRQSLKSTHFVTLDLQSSPFHRKFPIFLCQLVISIVGNSDRRLHLLRAAAESLIPDVSIFFFARSKCFQLTQRFASIFSRAFFCFPLVV
jgi:2-polyprenyl-3-methyl-5-hydroxy-6-metoxy-1,4-benzoquinol methylase